MKRYRMTATLEAPLVIRRERQSQRSEGVLSVPGTLVRGALAQAYLQRHGSVDETFGKLFLDESSCRYGPLDPGDRVFPLSAVSCKRQPGFLDDQKPEPDPEEEIHGMADQLWLRIAQRLAGKDLPQQLREETRRCRVAGCGQDLKNHSGFWTRQGEEYHEVKAGKRRSVVAHVGIDRYSYTAEPAIFYTLTALQPRESTEGDHAGDGPELSGVVEANEQTAACLGKLLAAEDGLVFLGHARARGHGAVRLLLDESPAPAPGDWTGWSEALLKYLAGIGGTFPRLDGERYFLFGLSLPTGAVLVDEVLRYTLDPASLVPWLPPLPLADARRPVLTLPARDVAGGRLWCLTAITKHERVRGWNAAHGLPRQDEWAVSRGAVYAYLFEGGAAGRKELVQLLSDLERDGLGLRRNEGFGRVMISDDFHRQFHEQESRP
jgi:hypothetical protein